MIRILDKGILFGLGAVLLFQRQEFVIPVVVLLTALIFSSFSLYLTDAKILGILWMGYLVLCVIRPEFSYFYHYYCMTACGTHFTGDLRECCFIIRQEKSIRDG